MNKIRNLKSENSGKARNPNAGMAVEVGIEDFFDFGLWISFGFSDFGLRISTTC